MVEDSPIVAALKRYALEQAAPPPPAPTASPVQAALSGMSAPMPNIQSPAPQVSLAGPQSMPSNVPSIAAPQPPTVTPVQSQPGPIKSFLQQFVHGAGQGLLQHVGLETDPQRQVRLFNQGQTAANNASEQGLRGAQADFYSGRNDALTAANQPVSQDVLTALGVSAGTTVLTKDLPKMIVARQQGGNALAKQGLVNQGNLATTQLKYGNGEQPGPLNTVIKDIGGRSLLMHKGTGEVIKDLGTANSITTANARAEAQARYGLVPTIDENGMPTTESRLSALQNGNPVVTFDAAKAFGSDQVGIQQYGHILKDLIQPNLKVLDNQSQRLIIAHTLAETEKNPGALQSLLTAASQQGLSPEGVKLIAGIQQSKEFGGVARKYGGNMNGTEGLMNRIITNQASPLNSRAVNQELINNDLAFTQKADKLLGDLTSHKQGGSATPQGRQPAPTAPPANTGLPSWDKGPI